ncbi:SpoIIE family protein phosphatase [Actinoplanes regularis]|uniref:SpoIIE family protein phosphatase n=1 Tax=Actinoplanes regularis TaxID=52697 RepID=UPI0024A1E9BC|nr:SpoIIE family protein phosphatase [Actinoplanes regularis]GLW36038.1 bifunctional protein kinase/phosphatase [Actinoplanes regularis]
MTGTSEQERLQVALDAAGMGTFVWHARQDYAESDPRMLELFALPADGVLSLAGALTSMIHPDDRQRYSDAVAAALDPAGDHQLAQDIRVRRRDDGYRWVAVTARAFFEGKPPQADRLVGVAADITRRREIELELRSSEQRRTFLLDLSDRVRLVTDPIAVQALAVEALGVRLAASRAMYLEVSSGSDGDMYTVERDYHALGTASGVGCYRADDFGATLFDELRAGRTLVVADVATDPRLTPDERVSYQRIGVAAYAAVPLIKDGRHVAALVLHQAAARDWDDQEITLVEEVAERTWAAVERARAQDALRESEARFRQVLQAAPQLIWVSQADGTVEMLNDNWSTIIGADPGTDDDRELLAGILHAADADGFLAAWDSSRAAGSAFDQQARLRIRDGTYRWYLIRVVGYQGGTKRFGVATDIHDRHSAEERALAEQTEARERDHRTALQLQRALLPTRTVERPGFDIAARYEAGSVALVVGGDWYDTFELPGGSIGLTVGDVVGHGLSAATTMGKMRIAMGALAPHAAGPGALLTDLDGFAAGNGGSDFATACYALLDPASRKLRHACAGHPPMLVVTADGRTRWLTDGGSAPITGKQIGARPEAIETLEPGALLLLYSDGLVERRGEPLTAGLDRLRQAALELRHGSAAEICDGLFAAMGVAEQRSDDVVALCLRMPAGTAAAFHRTLTADKRELSRLRGALQAWRRAIQPADRDEADMLLAVNEACANAIEHAYRGREPGTVEVTVSPDADGTYLASIRDFGRWQESAASSTHRGRGLGIIRSLSHGFEYRSTPAGTLVQFRLPAKGTTA